MSFSNSSEESVATELAEFGAVLTLLPARRCSLSTKDGSTTLEEAVVSGTPNMCLLVGMVERNAAVVVIVGNVVADKLVETRNWLIMFFFK
jgi:hypothetical protein